MIKYPAKITHSKAEGAYNVEFPDLPGCLTFGHSLEEALAYAKDALDGYLESIDLREQEIPQPSQKSGKGIHLIAPSENVAFAIWLKLARKKRNLTQKQLAAKMNIPYQNYQNFENPKKANPTLRNIAKLQSVLNERVLTI